MRPIVTVLAVALLVVLAGCGAAGTNVESPTTSASDTDGGPFGAADEEGEDTSSSGSAADSSGTGPSVPIPPADSFPDGTSIDGIVDPTTIVVAHLGHLEDSSFTNSRTETYATAEYTYTTTNIRSVDGPRQLMSVDYSGQAQEIYRASNASPNYIRWETESGVRYLVDHGNALFLGESTFFIQSLLEASTFEFDRWDTVDDQMVFEFTVESFDSTADLQSATPLETIDDLRGSVSIRDDGLITRLSVVLTGADFEGVQTEIQIEQSFSNVGTTTVGEPTWIGEAEDRAAVMEATLAGDGAYIEVTMVRGDEIPAGTQGYIYIGDIALESVFDAGIATGESFYIYESAAGELTVEGQAPPDGSLGAPVPADVSEVSVAMYHPDVGTMYVSTLSLEDEVP